MPHKTETALSLLLTMQPRHGLLFIKSKIIKKALDNPELFSREKLNDKEQELLVKELLRIELIATTVHYAETFAATLLAMRKYKRFHKFLLEYNIKEIRDFYTNIDKRRPSYITKLLQYPQPYQIQPKEFRKEIKKSVSDAHKELKILSKFYFKWIDFYNSYKHGFRVFASKPNPNEDFTLTCYPTKEKLNSFQIAHTKNEIRKILDLCEFMFKFLSNAESTFSQRVLEEKTQFQTTLFTNNRKKQKS